MEPQPLHIYSVPLGNGHIGLCAASKFADGGRNRTLENLDGIIDLDAVKAWGATSVLTLLGQQELDPTWVSAFSDAARSRSLAWHQVSIPGLDDGSPHALRQWRDMSPRLHQLLEEEARVLIHGTGGADDAETIAALLMVERGYSAEEAIDVLGAARPDLVEATVSTRCIRNYARHEAPPFVRLHASLLAGAVGDSLGADIEFLSLDAIRRRFPDGVDDLPRHQGRRGAITDDSQMTLFTAEGVIRALIRGMERGICHPPSVIHHGLLRWFKTQGGQPLMATDEVGLVGDPRLKVARAPGNTCLSALAACREFGMPARNNSKGCGTIMRVAPIGLMFPRDQVRSLALETSALTHGHQTGQFAAAAWAEMLSDVSTGADLEDSAEAIASAYKRFAGGEETAAAIQAALNAPRDGSAETVERLGGGWTADEALSIALYACLAGGSFERGLLIAATHGGDSDSTAAIAGNMLGLQYPAAVLQHRWSRAVEGADLVSRLVRDYAKLKLEPETIGELLPYYPGA